MLSPKNTLYIGLNFRFNKSLKKAQVSKYLHILNTLESLQAVVLNFNGIGFPYSDDRLISKLATFLKEK